jgi:hypothetical protein
MDGAIAIRAAAVSAAAAAGDGTIAAVDVFAGRARRVEQDEGRHHQRRDRPSAGEGGGTARTPPPPRWRQPSVRRMERRRWAPETKGLPPAAGAAPTAAGTIRGGPTRDTTRPRGRRLARRRPNGRRRPGRNSNSGGLTDRAGPTCDIGAPAHAIIRALSPAVQVVAGALRFYHAYNTVVCLNLRRDLCDVSAQASLTQPSLPE